MAEAATSRAPDFTLKTTDGGAISLSSLRGKKVVIFAFPRAGTPGCTAQACGFRDAFPQLETRSAVVLGISPDKPADLLKWTDGKALIATGSPFPPVDHGGVRHRIAQSNNALIFPGLGLGVAACGARRITEGMIAAAAQALAGLVNAYRPGAPLLPLMNDLRMVSATVALAVAKAAAAEGVAEHPLEDPIQQVYSRMWRPRYPQIELA